MSAAGVQHVCPVESFPEDKWDLIIAVNLSAAFHLTKHIVPGMKERGDSLCVCVCLYVCMCACVYVHVSWCVCFAASVYPAMLLAGWGRIVNTASGHGLVASVNKSAYIASKHGIVGLTKVSNSPTDHAALSMLTSHQVGKRPSLRQCTHLLQPLVTLLVGLHLLCVTVHVQGRDVLPCIPCRLLLWKQLSMG